MPDPQMLFWGYSITMEFIENVVNKLNKKMDKASLKKKLLAIREAAKEYERSKLPRGHDIYVRLLEQAEEAITQYSDTWNVDVRNLQMEFPFLHSLRRKAHPELATAASQWGSVLIAVVGLILLGVAIGAVIGVSTGVFDVANQAIKGWFGL